jgi:hypothetical protein
LLQYKNIIKKHSNAAFKYLERVEFFLGFSEVGIFVCSPSVSAPYQMHGRCAALRAKIEFGGSLLKHV